MVLVHSRGRQILLMKKTMSCGTVSCLKILMASLMRQVCHELIAACQSMWWSLIWECLTIDDFSKSPLRPCARCSLSLVGRFVLFHRCTLFHTHNRSGILPLCCWDRVCPGVCVEVLEVCWEQSGRPGCLLSGVYAGVYVTSTISRGEKWRELHVGLTCRCLGQASLF